MSPPAIMTSAPASVTYTPTASRNGPMTYGKVSPRSRAPSRIAAVLVPTLTDVRSLATASPPTAISSRTVSQWPGPARPHWSRKPPTPPLPITTSAQGSRNPSPAIAAPSAIVRPGNVAGRPRGPSSSPITNRSISERRGAAVLAAPSLTGRASPGGRTADGGRYEPAGVRCGGSGATGPEGAGGHDGCAGQAGAATAACAAGPAVAAGHAGSGVTTGSVPAAGSRTSPP